MHFISSVTIRHHYIYNGLSSPKIYPSQGQRSVDTTRVHVTVFQKSRVHVTVFKNLVSMSMTWTPVSIKFVSMSTDL